MVTKNREKSQLMVVDILVTLKLTLILRPMLFLAQALVKLSYSILRVLQRTVSTLQEQISKHFTC